MEKDDLRPLKYCALGNIRRSARAITRLYDEFLQPTGLKSTQFSVLANIFYSGPLSVSSLGELMLMDQTTVTRNLKPLMERNLLTSTRGEDGRSKLIAITPLGEEMLAQMLPLWEQAQQRVVSEIGQEQFKLLLGGLKTLSRLG